MIYDSINYLYEEYDWEILAGNVRKDMESIDDLDILKFRQLVLLNKEDCLSKKDFEFLLGLAWLQHNLLDKVDLELCEDIVYYINNELDMYEMNHEEKLSVLTMRDWLKSQIDCNVHEDICSYSRY